MHISYLYDIALPSPFAASIQILNTSLAACRQGATVDVYASAVQGSVPEVLAPYALEAHAGLRLFTLPPHRRLRTDLPRLRDMLDVAPAAERHVIMSRGECGIALLPFLAGRRSRHQRTVYEAHRLAFTYRSAERPPARWSPARLAAGLRARRVRRREAATLRAVQGLVCLTDGVRRALADEFGIDVPDTLLPSGTSVAASIPPDAGRDIDVLYAGKLEQRKGAGLLVDALRYLPDIQVWIVGGSPSQRDALDVAVRAVGAGQRTTLRGYMEPVAVRALLGRARVGVCPLPAGLSRITDEFTSPLKLLELMGNGVPVVATDIPAVRAIAEHDRTALLVPPNDARALADGIRRLLDDRSLARRLATAAMERARDFSWDLRAATLLAFLRDLP